MKNMRDWLETEGLASDLTEDIVNQYRSVADFMSTTNDYNATVTQQVEDLLKVARTFSIVGSIMLVLGFILYPWFRKRSQEYWGSE